MKRVWELEDLIDYFTIVPAEMKIVENKTGANRLGCAVLLKFFQIEGKFPNNRSEIPKPVIDYIAKQLFLSPEAIENYDWNGRTIKYHRSEIRDFFGFREDTAEDSENVSLWLQTNVIPYNQNIEHVKDSAYLYSR